MSCESERLRVLTRVVDHLVGLAASRPLRVAVDGITAAGKSTLASELAQLVGKRGRPAVHLSADHAETMPGKRSVRVPSTLARLGICALSPPSMPSPKVSHHLSQ